MGKVKDLAGARIDLKLTLDFKSRYGHKGAIFPSTPFFCSFFASLPLFFFQSTLAMHYD
jgi:hypothetical protein